jgi:hypothetical protein
VIVEHNGTRIAFIGCNFFFPYLWSISEAAMGRPGAALIYPDAELDPPGLIPAGVHECAQNPGIQGRGYTGAARNRHHDAGTEPRVRH